EGLEAGGRTLYTYTGTDEPDDVALAVASGEHRLSADNSALTRELMSVPDDAMRNDILTWVQTAPMSDPLHTKPLVAHYPGGDVIFTMSNQGF
ncbi:MAG TPA: hypothetical protein DD979_13210, partial [Gammaproteobacteria bacterium]|nr:hypothetical protein [Gammaproteobacteria bacterium]